MRSSPSLSWNEGAAMNPDNPICRHSGESRNPANSTPPALRDYTQLHFKKIRWIPAFAGMTAVNKICATKYGKARTSPGVKSILVILSAALAVCINNAHADDGMHMAAMNDDAHAHHHHMAQKVSIMSADYSVPQISLVREDNRSISLPDEINDGRPVILNFIYTTCTAVCPITSRSFAQLQDKLGEERDKVHMISITIDPEQDTPARLADYAHKFGAGSQWRFYTGTTEASLAAQRAFDVYRGDKMNHSPVTLLRAGSGTSWVRIDGFASADDLLREYRKLVAGP